MRYPEFLQEKGTIAFVAPSFGCATEPYKSEFMNAQEKWKRAGFSLEFGPNCYAASGVGISNIPEKCGEELTAYYCNRTSDCIISCGGGELMCEILDYVNFDEIQNAPPKWYMGFSDNTNMVFLMATLCDTAAIYGPCAGSFGMESWHSSLEDAMLLLQGQKLTMQGYSMWEKESLKDEMHPYVPYNLTETSVIKYILPDGRTNIESLADNRNVVLGNTETLPAGENTLEKNDVDRADRIAVNSVGIRGESLSDTMSKAEMEYGSDSRLEETGSGISGSETIETPDIHFEGRLLGGCMDCLVNLLGTRYDKVREFTERYKDDGIIWFLEACDLNLMSIRRAMWQMEHAGWFQYCKGFLIGRPLNGMGVEEFGIDHYQAAYEMLRRYHVPVLMDLDIGHLPPMMPLICGSMAEVVSDGSAYSVDMKLQ